MEDEYRLEDSRKGVGPLYPVLEDPYGNIIDGRHRRKVDPNWPSIVVSWVKSREDLLAARIAANVCRRIVPKEERKRELEELATIMLNRGVPKGKIAEEIAKKTGLSPDYVRQMLPGKFKLSVKAKAGVKGRAKQLAMKKESADTELYAREKILPSQTGQNSSVGETSFLSSSFEERLEAAVEESSRKEAELNRLLEYYPQSFMDYVMLRVGEITRNADNLLDMGFIQRFARRLLEILWEEVSADRFLMDAIEERLRGEFGK
ncbi:MAG: hypothetical protein ACTSXC_02130 [Candidatus Freyarchaeota archaeon]